MSFFIQYLRGATSEKSFKWEHYSDFIIIIIVIYSPLMRAIGRTHASTHASTRATSLKRVIKIAHTTSVYGTYCLGHWNEENKRKSKTSNLIVDHFSLTFFNFSLVWVLYFHAWLQNKGKFLVWSEYYARFFYKQHFFKQRQAEIGKKKKN